MMSTGCLERCSGYIHFEGNPQGDPGPAGEIISLIWHGTTSGAMPDDLDPDKSWITEVIFQETEHSFACVYVLWSIYCWAQAAQTLLSLSQHLSECLFSFPLPLNAN